MGNISTTWKLQQARNAAVNPSTIAKRKSAFYGDPIEVVGDAVSDALGNELSADDVPAASIVNNSASAADAAEKIAAYDSMSIADRTSITRLGPLNLWNGKLISEPVMSRILADNLNYNLSKSMVEYPYVGKVITATPNAGEDFVDITINDTLLDSNMGDGQSVVVPFVRFNISASTLNARPGSNYSIYFYGDLQNGRSIQATDPEVSEHTYAWQRIDATKAMVGVFIPFQVIATRCLPVLPIVTKAKTVEGSTVVAAQSFTLHFSGVTEGEVVSVSIMGYAMNELREISKMFNLPAGLLQ